MPGYTNPQSLNRYSYVTNNPLRYTDPTGHLQQVDDGGGQCDLICVQEHNQNPQHPQGGGGGGNGGGSTGGGPGQHGYSGPLASDIQSQLIAHGANPDLLVSVTIYVTTEEALAACKSNQLANTANSTINICTLVDINGDVVYDPHTPTPVLVHELVHVRQFRDNWAGTWIEVAIINVKKTINKDYNPYQESWVEIEGSLCQDAYKANPNIPLDSGACNLK